MSGWKSCWKYFETWLDSACRSPEEISTVSHSQERLAVLHEAFRQLEDRSAVFDPEFDADLVADVEAQGEAVVGAKLMRSTESPTPVFLETQRTSIRVLWMLVQGCGWLFSC